MKKSFLFALTLSILISVPITLAVSEDPTVTTAESESSIGSDSQEKNDSDSTERVTDTTGDTASDSTEDLDSGTSTEAVSGYMKLGDIKGESTDASESDGDEDASGGTESSSAERTKGETTLGDVKMESDSTSDPSDDLDSGTSTKAASGYIKLGDIKGESTRTSESSGDEAGTLKGDASAEYLDDDSDDDSIDVEEEKNSDRSSKAKEIVVVGSKVKDVVREFAEDVAKNDENIKAIEISEETVGLKYKQPARLFGFIKINLTISASADKEGAVKVKFPWYSFLTRHSVGELEADLNEEIQAMNKAELVDSIASDAGRQQNTLQTISNVLKAAHDAAMNSIRNMK